MAAMKREAERRRMERDAREDDSVIEVFRPRRWLRAVVLVAVAHWVWVFFQLVRYEATSTQAFAGVGFFIALFTILGIFYNYQAIEVTGRSVIVRGVSSFRELHFSDILGVDVKPGFLQTNYSVRSRRGSVFFTSLFADHQRLLALIVERARLSPGA